MLKKKSLFITFEGIEGSGKSFQSRKLFNKLKKAKLSVVFTREPGGSKSAEIIRKILLSGKKEKFTKLTDTLLYLASRSEHFERTIKPSIMKKQIIICDRFIDSTIAYQGYGHDIDKKLIDFINKKILGHIKPDLTFILKLNIKKAFKRVNSRRKKNRYDKFPKKFYTKVQKGFIEIAKKNKKRCFLLDTSKDTNETEKEIYKIFTKFFKR